MTQARVVLLDGRGRLVPPSLEDEYDDRETARRWAQLWITHFRGIRRAYVIYRDGNGPVKSEEVEA